MKYVKVPKHIDDPMQFAFWEIDEVIPVIALLFLGILTGTLTYMWPLMYLVVKLYQRYKTTARRGALLHFLFFYGLYDPGGKNKNGAARLFVG